MRNQANNGILSSLIDAETLYHTAPCGYFSTLPDGTIIKLNETFMRWVGFSEDEIVDKMKITDFFSNGGKLYYHVFFAPLLQLQAMVKEINFDIIGKDGSFFPALLSANTIKDTSGSVIAVNVVVTDITDRKKYEIELLNAKALAEAEKNKFEAVADYIPEMIWTADGNGRINYVNKRFADYFELGAAAPAKGQISAHVHPDDRVTAQRSWVGAINGGKDFSIQVRLKNKSGQFNWYLFKGTPLRDQGAAVNKWLGSCLNIQEHVTELERRDEFISVASHELKTPISSLNLALQILEKSKLGFTNSQVKMVEQSVRNAKKINTLIDELLNVKRLTEGQLSLSRRRFNVSKMVRNCISSFLAEKMHQLTESVDTELEIVADEHRIEQVIVNFINNAIKYAPDSPILITAENLDGKAKISVIDQGPGIAPDKVPRLFERYYRADHSGVEYSGLGLGLYICSEIIKRHGGHIGVDSEPGKGSKFWFIV